MSQDPAYLSHPLAIKACNFFENLTLIGDYSGEKWNLDPWQRDWISQLYGERNPDGTRKINKVSLWFARGAGKTQMAAGVACYELLFGNPGREIYCASSDREKASRLFKAVAQMIRHDKHLSRMCDISDHYLRIKVNNRDSILKCLASNEDQGHSLSPSMLVLDEIQLFKHRSLYDSLISGFGKRKKGSTLEFQISTAGNSKTGLAWDLYTYAKNVKLGIITDSQTLVRIFEAEEDDDWTDPKVWAKCMPWTYANMEFIENQFKLAQHIRHQEFAFRQLYLGQWLEHSEETWISHKEWEGCIEQFTEQDLVDTQEPVYLGLDLSSVRDLTSLSLYAPDSHRALSWSWLPSEGIAEREDKDGVTYRKWRNEGHLFTTTGARIVHSEVAEEINKILTKFNVVKFVADPYSLHLIAPHLIQEPERYPQSPGHMSPPSKWFESAIAERKIKHNGNPLLAWAVGHTVVEKDKYENISPHKGKSTKRIDPCVALVMAIGAFLGSQEKETPEFYADKGNFIF